MGKQTLELATFYFLERCPTADIGTDVFKSCLRGTNATTIEAVLAQIPSSHKSKIKMLKQRLTQLEEKEMAKNREPRAHDAEAETATQIYQVAQADMQQQLTAMRDEIDAVRVESQAAGALQAIETTIAFNEFLKAITLSRIKQNKEYKKGGMTWVDFCESLGLSWRTVDLMLEDIRPVIETFSAKLADFTGMPFSKIRLLGKHISANLAEIQNNCLVYGEESIPLTPEYRDDIQALIERIGEDAKEKVDEAEAKLSAKDKVLKSKQDLLNKQERDLKKFERETAKRGLSPEEDALLGKIDELGIVFNGHCLQLENVFAALEENPIPSAVAAFASLMDNVRARVSAMRESAVLGLAPTGMYPDEEWSPKIPGAAIEE